MSTTSSADKTACLVAAIQEILLSEPSGLPSREIAHRLVLIQAPYSSSNSQTFIKRVQRLLSSYNPAVRLNKGNCFIYDTEAGLWSINRSYSQDSELGFGPSTPPAIKKPFQLSRNTSMTTTTVTPTPSTSSLSVISSVVGSSLTTGIMEQVSTWRTGADTDDDDEASLEIYSNPSMNRASFPSQNSRGESHGSAGSLLNGMEIMPTLHQLQFPQHPLDQPDDNDIMPPPSSTTSGYRRHSMSSQHRPVFGRLKRSSQDENTGDQLDPSTTRSPYHILTAEILARSVRQNESRNMDGSGDQGSVHTLVNKSGFPSPQSTTPSPRIPTVQNFIQPLPSASPRGDLETHRRNSSSHSGQLRLSPNQLESSRQRSLGRRSMDEMKDEDDPMHRETPRPIQAPSPRFAKEDPRLRDLGASLQKSLSFNGDDEYQEMNREDERHVSHVSHGRNQSVRHHPYLSRPRLESSSQRLQSERPVQRPLHSESLVRDRRERNRATVERDEDREIMGKTPLLLNAINTSMTNILSEIQSTQRQNQGEIAHFREELYQSLQRAFTQLADQLEGVGRAVVSVENAHRESIQQLAHSIGDAVGEGFTNLSESLQQQIQMQIQQKIQQALQPYRAPSSRPSSRPTSIVGPSQPLGSNSFSSPPPGTFGFSTGNPRPRFGSPFGGREGSSGSGSGGGSTWRRSDPNPLQEDYDEHNDDEEDHGRGKRRAVERQRSTSASRRTTDRPRREFEN